MSAVLCSRRRRRVRAYSTFCLCGVIVRGDCTRVDWERKRRMIVRRDGEEGRGDATYSTDAIAFVESGAEMRVICCRREQCIRQLSKQLIQIHRDVFCRCRRRHCVWSCMCMLRTRCCVSACLERIGLLMQRRHKPEATSHLSFTPPEPSSQAMTAARGTIT